MGSYQSGQMGRAVDALALRLRGFESLTAHKFLNFAYAKFKNFRMDSNGKGVGKTLVFPCRKAGPMNIGPSENRGFPSCSNSVNALTAHKSKNSADAEFLDFLECRRRDSQITFTVPIIANIIDLWARKIRSQIKSRDLF